MEKRTRAIGKLTVSEEADRFRAKPHIRAGFVKIAALAHFRAEPHALWVGRVKAVDGCAPRTVLAITAGSVTRARPA